MEPPNEDQADRLKELVDRAAEERDKVKFAELLWEISRVLAERRQKPVTKPEHVPAGRESDVFDIFSGSSDRDAVWIESATGLDAAKSRMHAIAESAPGEYFIFHATSHVIIHAEPESPQKPQSEIPPKKSGVV